MTFKIIQFLHIHQKAGLFFLPNYQQVPFWLKKSHIYLLNIIKRSFFASEIRPERKLKSNYNQTLTLTGVLPRISEDSHPARSFPRSGFRNPTRKSKEPH